MGKIFFGFLTIIILTGTISAQSSQVKYSDNVKVNSIYTWKVESSTSDNYAKGTEITVKILKDLSSLTLDIDTDLVYDPPYTDYSCTNNGQSDACDFYDFIIPVKMVDGSSYFNYLKTQSSDTIIGGIKFVKNFSVNSGQLTYVHSAYSSQNDLLYRTTTIFDSNGIMTSLIHSSSVSYKITGYEVNSSKSSSTPILSFPSILLYLSILTISVQMGKRVYRERLMRS